MRVRLKLKIEAPQGYLGKTDQGFYSDETWEARLG